mmetsp:Transcript_18303/g.29776  ORF Transcript_18303/g.29776 Transcript_18303/m.29776 type:complete len:180 (+) Transcript_18303:46-585(+)
MGGWLDGLLVYSGSLWFPVLVALLHAADTFILFVPNDPLMIAAVAAKPSRWALVAFLQTAGCALGCVCFCAVALNDPQGLKERYPSVFESESWQTTEHVFQVYGVASAVVLGSVLPIHPSLFVGVMSGLPLLHLVLAICAGRLVRNLLFCFLAGKAPGFSFSGFFGRFMGTRKNTNKKE